MVDTLPPAMLRIVGVWFVIIAAETIHGIARTLWLAPGWPLALRGTESPKITTLDVAARVRGVAPWSTRHVTKP